VLHQPEGELVLCLRGGGYDDKVLHLRSSKCTFGSRADCTVQVSESTPLQCVILRGPGGTVVRDWSGASRLNGQPFSDAALSTGDCLQVGSVEAKVLADFSAEAAARASAAAWCQPPLPDQQIARENAATLVPGSDACPADIHDRFDRLETRLSRLERMIGELLQLQHQTKTHSAVTDMTSGNTFSPHLDSEMDAAPAAASAPQPPRWTEPKYDEELDHSVREYIEQLLGRVSEPNAEPVPAAEDDWAAAQRVGQPDQQAVTESLGVRSDENLPEAAAADVAEEPWPTPQEPPLLAPLSLRPESESHLNAMREVANLSAIAAIRGFEQQEVARKSFDRLPLLLTGLACGLMLLYSAFSSGKSGMFLGAVAAFVAAALTAWQLLALARRWRLASQPVPSERPAGEQA